MCYFAYRVRSSCPVGEEEFGLGEDGLGGLLGDDAAVVPAVADIHAVSQHLLEGAVVEDEGGAGGPRDLFLRIFDGSRGQVRVNALKGGLEAGMEDDVFVSSALGEEAVVSDFGRRAGSRSRVPGTIPTWPLRRWIR